MNLLSVPRQPFVGLASIAATGIALADFRPFPLSVLLVVLLIGSGLLVTWPNTPLTYAVVGLGFFWLHSFHVTDSPGLRLAMQLGANPPAITATGAVISEPKVAANGLASFLLRLDSIEIDEKHVPTNAVLLVRWRGYPSVGDEITLFGVVEAIRGPRNPGEFDMRSYLSRRDIRHGLLVRYRDDGRILRHHHGNPVLRGAEKSRRWMQTVLCRGLADSPDVENFIGGIALGLRHQTAEDIEEPFQQTGTLHLFAVAGLHVGIVARLLWMLATAAQLSRRWAAGLIIPAVFFYAAITGLHVSSVRAAIMSSVLLGALFFERRVFVFNSLAAAAFFLLCWNTNELFSTGFQLSFSVVGAILLLTDPFYGFMRRWGAPDALIPSSLLGGPRRFLDNCFRWLCRGISVSLAAWLGSLALIYWHFNLVSPVSLFANLFVVPLAFFVLAIGLLSLLVAPLASRLSLILNGANWLLAKLVLGAVHLFAQVPGGHYYLEHPRFERPALASITVLDVGAGAAVHLRTAGADWLLDCGSGRDYERVLRSYLHFRGINRLAGLLLTHGDALHIGGAGRLLNDLPPEVLIDNPAPDRSAVHRKLRLEFERPGFKTKISNKRKLTISRQTSIQILSPDNGSFKTTADDQSLIVQLSIGPSTKVLFVSDIGYDTEHTLIAGKTDLRSDILIKGQHHSGRSGSDKFLEAVRPRLIIATSRDFPPHERVREEWAAHVRAKGIAFFRQDETGAVELRFDNGSWEARSYVTGEIFRSSSR